MENVSYEIFDLLYRLGVSANYLGFFQTAYAVELCRAEPERLLLVTKLVYPDVARLCKTSRSAVESNIRTVCGIAWRNNRRLLEQLAFKPFPQKPQNSQFLALLLYGLPAFQSIPGKAGLTDRFPARLRQEERSEEQGENRKGT